MIFFFLFGDRVAVDDHLANVPISELIKQIKWPTGKDLIGLIPIVQWLPRYQFKENILADVIGGLTLGAMMVPQSEISLLCDLHSLIPSFWLFLV